MVAECPGLTDQLKHATVTYTESDGHCGTTYEMGAGMRQKHGVASDILHGIDCKKKWTTGRPMERLALDGTIGAYSLLMIVPLVVDILNRELHVRTFIFLCDLTTEQECLDRSLFGTNAGENLQHHYSQIAVGDRLFLYNFETGAMRGPFTALTACIHNIDPKAWKKARRSFPWQVRVDGSRVSKSPVRADDFARFIPLAQTKVGLLPPAELNEDQVRQLLTLFDRQR